MGPILLNKVDCTGDEPSLLSCSFSNKTSQCEHNMDVWISCSSAKARQQRQSTVDATIVACIPGDVLPLIGGSDGGEGLVEVCTGTGYYPVSVETLSVREASVVCRQLKLGSGELRMFIYNAFILLTTCKAGYPVHAVEDLGMQILHYYQKNGAAQLKCTGREESTEECSVTFIGKISPADFGAVICKGDVSCIMMVADSCWGCLCRSCSVL